MEILDEEKEGFVRWFSQTNRSSLDLGEKARGLLEVYNLGLNVPPCFVLSSKIYDSFLSKSNISGRIQFLLESINYEDFKSIEENSSRIRDLILNCEFTPEIEKEIFEAYDILTSGDSNLENLSPLEALSVSGEPAFVAVRSSLIYNEILEDSFSGQQDSYLNVKGKQDLIKYIKKCFASLFNSRAVYYRKMNDLDYTAFSMAIVVQKMVDSDKSGVCYSDFSSKGILIESSFGLGEGITSGQVTPDRYFVSKEMEIKSKEVNKKNFAFTRDSSGSLLVVKLKEEVSLRQVLSDYEINRVAELADNLEKSLGYPVEMEFAIEAKEIFILQVKPFSFEEISFEEEVTKEVLLGIGGSKEISKGNVLFIKDLKDLEKISSSDVVVVNSLFSELIVPIQKAKGVISKYGGFSSYLGILCRQKNIPCVLGVEKCFEKLREGEEITLDGFSGKIFEGDFTKKNSLKEASLKQENFNDSKKILTKTKFKVFLDSPESSSFSKSLGLRRVGLLKFEKDFSSFGKHPLFFEKSKNYSDYSRMILESISKMGNGFEEIWISSSDFNGEIFSNLEGSLEEKNPFLGKRGIRFSKLHEEIFRSEIKAVKKFLESFSGSLGIIVPFLSDVSEIKFVKKILNEEGLLQRVKLGVYLQTPSSVQVIKELYEEKIDLVLLDVKSFAKGVLSFDFDSSNTSYFENIAIIRQIEYLLRFCKRNGLETYAFLEEKNSFFNRFLIEKEISGVVVSPFNYPVFSKEFSDLEEEILKNTDKEPRLYELKKREEIF